MVLEDLEQEDAKMPELDTAKPEDKAQDECLGNKVGKSSMIIT